MNFYATILLAVLCLMLVGGAMSDEKSLVLSDLGNASGWEGVTADPAMEYKGVPSLKWEHAESDAASTESIPHDWSSYNCLKFALHSAKANGSTVVLMIASENPKSEGANYFGYQINIDWTGWREFAISYNDVSRVRRPIGWNKIDSIRFAAEYGDFHPNPETVLHIADLKLDTLEGPWISDEELFSILNLGHPGMEKVKAAVGSGDLKTARHEFAEYLRHREKPVWRWDWRARPKHDARPKGVDTEKADRVMNHEVWSCDIWHKFDGQIDWNRNPIDYLEWPWQLNRHSAWVWLADAYWATGEAKYAQEFSSQVQDWIRLNPAPRYTSGNNTYTWRTIEQGIRTAGSWMDVYHRFLTSPSFTDDAIIMMVKSFVEHARILEKYPTTGNWLTMETNGLMHIGVMFPEFNEAAGWRKTAADRLYVELDKQVYPDGAQIELSTGYHQVSLGNLVRGWEIAKLNDVPMPADYVAKIGRMYDYNLNAAMPNKALPGLNDAGRVDIRGSLKQGFDYFPERKDYQWIATEGKEGERPKVGSIALPFSGQLVMRTGWDRDDLYLLMDAGPFGYGHQHEDALSIVVYSHGKDHVVDAGNYPYDSSQWRAYVLSTRGHNTIVVDGQDQHRRGKPREQYVVTKPLPNRWIAGKGFDYASGTYDEGYGPDNEIKVAHSRHIFFVKPEYWVVTDFLDPEDAKSHKYESLFHLETSVAQVAGLSVRTTNKDVGNLAIIAPTDDCAALRVVSGQEKPVVMGWMRSSGYDVRPVPTAIYEKEQAGPASFQYIFYPTAKQAECPITGVKRLGLKSASGIEITFADGHTDYFVQAQKPGRLVEFQGFRSNAAATYISTKDGKVVKAMLAGGTFLLQGDQRVPAEIGKIEDLSKTEQTHKF